MISIGCGWPPALVPVPWVLEALAPLTWFAATLLMGIPMLSSEGIFMAGVLDDDWFSNILVLNMPVRGCLVFCSREARFV